MSAKSSRVSIRFGCLAILLGSAAFAQTPTPQQIQAFKNLPPDQQQALMQSYLGGSQTSGSGAQTNSKRGAPNNLPPR